MSIGTDVKGLAKKFEEGKLNNAKGSRIEYGTESDRGLATNNHQRMNFQFTAFQTKTQIAQDEEATSLALALKLQQEEEDAALARALSAQF
ncbi:hypothetical protein [Candidatus Berkiella aquae]|uniref:Uncharacterized protein n=1 Tax=Candidatus Berkiella aquae TaxID=295108 RepID=A0A0Q9YVG3_9GAMM|nr:hypothetical protein [Candidatus Berkiella aquae]MCS5710234.1 hypothetical protein [Candidatus Berkiella aquae]